MTYERSTHHEVEAKLKYLPGFSVAYLLTNGHLANLEAPELDKGRVIGTDALGVEWHLPVGVIAAWAFMPPQDAALEAELPDPEANIPLGAMEAWQAAFMELRAVCDASEDPQIVEAVAKLEAIEVSNGN